MALLNDKLEFTRPQILTLTAGLLQLAFSWLDLFHLSADYHVVQTGIGALGVVMAWRLDLARMYGLLLLLAFGSISFSLNDVSTESFLEVRTAMIGLIIVLARPAKDARR